MKVQFDESFSGSEAVVEVVNAWKRKGVFLSNVIEGTVVDAHPHSTIFVFD